jgi:glucose-6-phosphate isomerase
MDTVNAMAPVIGKYYSNEWVRTNILNQTKEDMEEQDELIGDEAENPQFQQLVDGGMGGSAMGGAAIEAPIAPPALPAPSKPGAK